MSTENRNYTIIVDEKRLQSFIDWLPELHRKETYYVCLFARSKYSNDDFKITGGQLQLRRFISNKEYLFSKIRQLEVPYGAYTDNGRQIPQQTLALYITPNPRNIEKATKNAIKKLTELVLNPYSGYNPYSEVLSELQTTYSRKVHMNFDFDDVDYKDVLITIEKNNIMNIDAIDIVKTRGGFHLMANVDKIHDKYRKSWYLGMTKIPGWDKKSGSTDGLLPIPGCVQGGFSPYMFPAVSPQLIDVSGSL